MWWQQIIIMIASYVISAMLAPKPKNKPAALDDIEFPQFEEGSPQEVFFGDVWTESWMVLGTGNFRTKKIKKSDGLGGSTVVGFKYYMGILMGLARGPLDEILEIQVGDREAWSGSVTTNATINIDKPGLFGGKKREGGIVGTVNFLFGGPTQVPDPSISVLTGTPVPGLRGITTAWFDGYFAANSPYPKVWKFRARRILKGWYQDACWYPAKAVISLEAGAVKAMNPAHIVYECLTNPLWGRGLAAAKLDAAAVTAAADKFYAENFGLCMRWTRQDSIRNFLQSVLDHAGAALYEDRVTGLIKLVAIRGDYTVASLPLFDYDTGLLEVEDDDNGAQSVGVNEVIVQYRRAADNESRQVRVQNLGAMYGNGKIAQKVEYPGLPTFELATLAAQRDLRAGSGFLKRFRLRMDRRAYNSVPPAGVFRFSAPDLDIAQMVVRIGSTEEGDRDGALTVTVLQDHFSLDSTYYVSDEPNTFVVPDIAELPEGGDATSITVISQTITAPPGSPADGDQYLVPSGATGAWASNVGYIATWNADEAVWDFTLPSAGTIIYVQAAGGSYTVASGAGGTMPLPWTPSPTTTPGDLIKRGASADERLPIGSVGQVLTVVGSAPAWADNVPQVLAWKTPVRAATTTAGTLASSFANGSSIDGVTLATGDRILIKNQAAGAENGIYTVNASGAPTRAADADASVEILGATVFVSEGTANGDKQFTCTTNAPITLGTTALVFAQISGGGSGSVATDTIFDAKGDLAVGTGSNTAARLPVGTDGQIPYADSAEATGIRWGDPPAGGGGGGSTVFSGASVKFTSDKAVSASLTPWSWDAAEWDTDGYWSAGAPTRLTIPTGGAGKYLLSWSAYSTGATDYDVALLKNGTAIRSSYGAGIYQQYSDAAVVDCAAGDYFEIGTNVAHTQESDRSRLQITRLSGPSVANEGSFYPPMTTPVAADFTWVNQGGASVVDRADRMVMSIPHATGVDIRLLKRALPSPPYTVTAALALTGARNALAGLMLRESSSGKLEDICFNVTNDGGVPFRHRCLGWSAASAASIAVRVDTSQSSFGTLVWFRIVDDATNRIMRFSINGRDWQTIYTVGRTTNITANEVGIYGYNNSIVSAASKISVYHFEIVTSALTTDDA